MNVALVANNDDVNALSTFLSGLPGTPSVWVGVQGPDSAPTLDSGARATFFNWNSNTRSTGSSTAYCVESLANGKWNDVVCTSTRRVVCSAFRESVSTLTPSQLFVLVPNLYTYDQAIPVCNSLGYQLAHAFPGTESTLGKLITPFNAQWNAWLGINDKAVEGSFVYELTNRPASGLNWNAGEPNNAGDEDCVEMSGTGRLNDNVCSRTRWPLCSRFNFEVRNPRRFVVVHNVASCDAAGLSSDTPQNQAENDAVQSIVRKTSATALIGARRQAYNKNVFARDLNNAAISFNKWAPGEPNNVAEECIELRPSDGFWKDITCGNVNQRVCVV
eukprot:c14934_g2_i1.p1 GENE.c14934_g2_i1~~c14934_g2_i1.p1  ORF type:complete len:387 (+),score=83.25 c14934_g2_i1:169-1161(+)